MKLLLLALSTLAIAARAQNAPAVSETYLFSPEFPKYVTAHIEFRDPAEKRWPSFFYGKPSMNGSISTAIAKPAASFVLQCDQRPQKNGDQSRRVMGELFDTPAKGGVLLRVTGMGALVSATDPKNLQMKTTLSGELEVADRKISFTAPTTLRAHQGGRGDEKNDSLMGELTFDTKAADLGLKRLPAEATVVVKAGFTAYPVSAGQRRKP